MRVSFAVLMVVAVAALAGAPTAGAAANGLEVSSENITAAEDVGYRIDVGIRGRITAISPGRIARRCRRTRDGQVINFSIAGEKYSSRFRIPSTVRFNLHWRLEYGGIPDDGG